MEKNDNVEKGSTPVVVTNITHESKRSRLRNILIVLAVLLFILAVVFITLYIHTRLSNQQTNEAKSTEESPRDLCKSEGCTLAASSRLEYIFDVCSKIISFSYVRNGACRN